MRKILGGLFGEKIEPIVIRCENQSCINLSKNIVFHDKSKHIEIKYHFIQDMVQKGIVKLQYKTTYEQVVDVMTNPLSMTKIRHF